MNLKGFAISLLIVSSQAVAQPAYQIKVTLKPFTSGYLYLAHHFGNKQYLIDSARINEKSEAVFSGKEKLFGGVYMIVFPQKNSWIECMVDKDQHFSVEADTVNLFRTTRYSGSADNTLFSEYQLKSYELGTAITGLQKQIAQASPAEAEKLKVSIQEKSRELQLYREDFMKAHPEHLLTAIFNVLKDPVVPPASQHPGGKYDSVYAYQYYKSHFWDNVSFSDERLVRTPVFQPKLERYFNDVLPQHPDSLKQAAGEIIDASQTSPEMFKFLLSTLTDKYVNPAYMGQDAVFVYLFEKYYLTGQADSWMNDKYKKFIFDRGYSLMANVIGNPGANFEFLDTAGKRTSLYAINGPYTVICFWDPTCSHCKEEVPKLDSLFQQKWKKQGVKLLGMMTEGGMDAWLKFIREHNLKDWIHVYQTQAMKDADRAAGKPGFRQLYDVYQTPMLYLLDKDKRIIAKKLTYQQLDEMLQVKIKSGAAIKYP
jgi:peroxiredoxin